MQLDFYEDRLNVFLEELKKAVITEKVRITDFKYKKCGYKTGNSLPEINKSFTDFKEKDRWGGEDDSHAWFYKKLKIPGSMQGKNIELNIGTQLDGWDAVNPQFIVYLDGELVQGLDTNHREVFLDCAKAEYELYLYAYAGKHENFLDLNAYLISYDYNVRKLYYSLKVPYEITLNYEPHEKTYIEIENHIIKAINLTDMRELGSEEFKISVKAALDYLEKEFFGKYCKAESVNAICIGHTHIDVAWQWTLAQTREKVLRSFSTVLALMKKYPEYKFMSSQPQLYKYLREESPELYERVREAVKAGLWEVEGAMWVEADCNLSSGESLVRQILYGKTFMKEEFNVDSKVLWLPDVFGYSAALPQILKKSGVDKFVTSKIGWNETNKMPYDTFMWEGIDGTDIFAYFMTAQDKERGKEPATNVTYNAKLNPSQLQGGYDRYQQKDINDEILITFGYGDGGGGPTVKDLEYYDILKKGITGVPNAKMEFSGTYLDRIMKKTQKNKKLPRWQGELYLEYHRGTYTSMAQNKKFNRKSEFMFENAETLSLMNERLTGAEYPQKDLHDSWETILLNQFHDIIPGSSIKEVYDVSKEQYLAIQKTGNNIIEKSKNNIAEKLKTDGGVLVFNPNSFDGEGAVRLNGKTVYVSGIPAKGYKVLKEVKSNNSIKLTDKSIENNFFKLTLDKTGAFSRIYDKKNKREVLKKGRRGNVLTAYEDLPRDYDNWEISNYYTDKAWEINDLQSIEQVDDGVRAGLKITKKFLKSTIEQTVWLYDDIAKIDFDNNIDWKESHLVVKTAFPVDINSDKATYEIQYGCVERPTHKNTSWDAARFEVCAHKYADLSEYGYGVSILNDCKYGHDIHNGVISLTLLKCGTFPNPEADKCRHSFTYSLYPHKGNFREAGTVKKAYELNAPMTAARVEETKGTLPESYSFISCDCDNVIIETVKKAENGSGIIARMYESFNKRTDITIKTGFDFDKAYICDLLENEETEIKSNSREIKLTLKPFEIVTVKFK